MAKAVLCSANTSTTLVRNIAARGRLRTFVLRTDRPVGGTIAVRNGLLPFFIGARRREVPLNDGVEIKRGFFDASFEMVVTADADVQIRLD